MPKQKPNEQVQQIPLSEIRPFKNHPFKVTDDELMQQTIDSIMQVGVLNPAIIRPAPEGGYEMVAGHRRLHAADLAGLKTIPAIVRNLDDDEAVILMVDSNLQRETISPMERAQAYKMKLEALKHQGKRVDLTCDQSVYMLHTDNTEAMAFDAEDIRSFDGIFGVELSEWETVKDRITPPDYEKAFLSNPADSFAIYQLRDNDNTAQLRFMNAEYLEKKGLSIEKGNYAAVYAGNLDRRGDTQDRLDELYETFNLRRPEDFRGHSLSVSDIVALKQNGVVSCHYVDSRGFKALPDFLKPENYLKNAEMAMEDDYGMIDGVINNGPKQTVAELEEQAKSGKPVSLMELAQAARREQAQAARQEKKPSVLAKLCPPVNEPKKTARSKRAERELL